MISPVSLHSFRYVRYLWLVALSLFLAACAAPIAAPEPPPETQPAGIGASPTPPSAAVPQTDPPEPGPQPIRVSNVSIEIGQGSPIPVNVFVSGEFPHVCAQLAIVEQRFVASRVDITLLASPPEPDCPPDNAGLPFRFLIPLNMAEQPQGSYSVAVNGVETSFDWVSAGDGVAQAANPGAELRPIPIDDVHVEVGSGSPIPVEAVVSGAWPDLCAQLARIDQKQVDGRFEISLLGTAAQANCPPDRLGLPFRIAIPLNMVELPLGETRVSVNGVETSFDWQAQPNVTPQVDPVGAAVGRIVYIGNDGNLWVLDQPGMSPRQITNDGIPVYSTQAQPEQVVYYNFPEISSDGVWLAYRRDEGIAVDSGYQYSFGLWAANLDTGEVRQLLDEAPAGFSWKPGAHLLTYGLGVDQNYWMTRGQPNPELARGIWAVDLDGGVPAELVRPERGFTLARPIWSPDGRWLSFEEVADMEGSGMFATFDLGAQKYTSWEKPLGQIDWSPDGAKIAYDFMVYTATGAERIYLNSSSGGAEVQFSPDPPTGYAWLPAFSPEGDRMAYTINEGLPEDAPRSLVVQSLDGGEPQVLGVFENILDLEWTRDGASLVFSAGPFERRQVVMVNVSDGTSANLAEGGFPALTTP